MDVQTLLTYKNNEEEFALNLSENDIEFLVSELASKNDESRYIAFKTLLIRSELHDDVYLYFNDFIARLHDNNSYQRSIGIMLIAKNIRWDKDNLFNAVYNNYFKHFSDEKFITSRQTIQSVTDWIFYRVDLAQDAANALMSIDLDKYKDTQKSLLLYDIFNTLIEIYKLSPSEYIKNYLNKNIQRGLLSKDKVKKFADILSSLKIYYKDIFLGDCL